ncbi:hypothetical protein ASC80_21490 [Afipia sp. Root123D2]|nr:hypothetical protein ASC80_21490 [Afipia sp. Root123D2]
MLKKPIHRVQAIAAVCFFGTSIFPSQTVLAGPCASDIAQVETAMDALASNQGSGSAHQSHAANLHHQPTPNSVRRGKEKAGVDERHDRAALQRARMANAKGDMDGCAKALAEARRERLSQ